MQKSTLILLFAVISLSVIISVAGVFVLINPPAAKSTNTDVSKETTRESFRRKTDEDIWLKELASIKNPKKSYSYPVQEIYIDLNPKN